MSDAKIVASKVNIDEIWMTISKWGTYSALAHEHRHTLVNVELTDTIIGERRVNKESTFYAMVSRPNSLAACL